MVTCSLAKHVWSLGTQLAQVAFDAGRRKAVTEQVQATYDATVASYRQTVLIAFQEVEDNLAALRILEAEAEQQARVLQTAETALNLAINRYKSGITTYLEVIAAQSVALTPNAPKGPSHAPTDSSGAAH